MTGCNLDAPSNEDDGGYDEDEDDGGYEMVFGCCFPGRCCMPGPHFKSECCTAEMMDAWAADCEVVP
jgi:hypothetical protein